MSQPAKNPKMATKPKKRRVSVNKKPSNPNRSGETAKPKKVYVYQQKPKRKHPEFGTSKLEQRFATNFLDKLGIEYVWQYKAESIGRYFDFRIMPDGPIIEINGSYWHGDKRLYEEEDLNRTQKRNIKVDGIKKKWCDRNGIPIVYIWEKDINNEPDMVMRYLKEVLGKYSTKKIVRKNKQDEKSIHTGS
jgi:very-short-patch-repair endonuclease